VAWLQSHLRRSASAQPRLRRRRSACASARARAATSRRFWETHAARSWCEQTGDAQSRAKSQARCGAHAPCRNKGRGQAGGEGGRCEGAPADAAVAEAVLARQAHDARAAAEAFHADVALVRRVRLARRRLCAHARASRPRAFHSCLVMQPVWLTGRRGRAPFHASVLCLAHLTPVPRPCHKCPRCAPGRHVDAHGPALTCQDTMPLLQRPTQCNIGPLDLRWIKRKRVRRRAPHRAQFVQHRAPHAAARVVRVQREQHLVRRARLRHARRQRSQPARSQQLLRAPLPRSGRSAKVGAPVRPQASAAPPLAGAPLVRSRHGLGPVGPHRRAAQH